VNKIDITETPNEVGGSPHGYTEILQNIHRYTLRHTQHNNHIHDAHKHAYIHKSACRQATRKL